MAYLIGLVTKEEAAELVRRGWELKKPPPEFCTDPYTNDQGMQMKMIWVDANLFDIADGPDWEKGNSNLCNESQYCSCSCCKPTK